MISVQSHPIRVRDLSLPSQNQVSQIGHLVERYQNRRKFYPNLFPSNYARRDSTFWRLQILGYRRPRNYGRTGLWIGENNPRPCKLTN